MKRPYREGDWFAIPLGDGRFAAGIVTHGTRKAIYGSFFGSARAAIPQLEELAALRPADALWSGRFSDRAIVQQRWPVIGAQPGFVRSDWGAAQPAPAAGPGLMERRLAALAAGTAFEPARLSVRDVRSPIEPHAFDRIPDRVCLQWCEPLSPSDLGRARIHRRGESRRERTSFGKCRRRRSTAWPSGVRFVDCGWRARTCRTA